MHDNGSDNPPAVDYRLAVHSDIPALARIRAAAWGTEAYWVDRITRYLNRVNHPYNNSALDPRVMSLASDGNEIVGFVAGHLTRRFDCDGEVEWINVVPSHQRTGLGSRLLGHLAAWFVEQNARRICVDPDDEARGFYSRHGARALDEHWLYWPDVAVVLADVPVRTR